MKHLKLLTVIAAMFAAISAKAVYYSNGICFACVSATDMTAEIVARDNGVK